jgi:hypothetical protein
VKKIVIASIAIIIIAIIIVSLSIVKPSTNSTFQPPSSPVTPNNTLPTVVTPTNNVTLPTTPRHLVLGLDEKINLKSG